MGETYPGSKGRRRAIELKAMDASDLLRQSGLTYVLNAMTTAQIGQVQKVLDAAVVNPAVRKLYDEMMRRSVINPDVVRDTDAMRRRYGDDGQNRLSGRNGNLVNQADRFLAAEKIFIQESDKAVRLDPAKLLTPDALKPRTDNPDERAYLLAISNTLRSKGVWLRIGQPFVRDPTDPSRSTIDARTFQAWLSVGPDGAWIPTKDGRIDRDALLDRPFGAGYYRKVVTGKVQSTLNKALKIVGNKIADGRDLYTQEDWARFDAVPGVVWVSDRLGDAKFPSKTLWDAPNRLLQRARQQNSSGNVKDSSVSIMIAAVAAEASAAFLDKYIDDTMRGAGKAVKILSIVSTVGQIAGIVLAVFGIFTALTRILALEAAEGGGAGLRALAPGEPPPVTHSPAAYANTNLVSPEAEAKTLEAIVDKAAQTMDSAAGAVGGAAPAADVAYLKEVPGFFEELRRLTNEAYNSYANGRLLTMDEIDKIAAAAKAKFGL